MFFSLHTYTEQFAFVVQISLWSVMVQSKQALAIEHLSKAARSLSDLSVRVKDERKGRTNAETALKEGR